MRVLVTGGAGYIGSVTSNELLTAGHTVIIFDSLVHGYRAAAPLGAVFAQGDIQDRTALDAVIKEHQPEAVVHLAAFIEAGESMRDPAKYFRNNVGGSLNLIETIVARGIRRLVFSSTAAVYAASEQPLREDAVIAPVNCYGETKLMIERMLGWYNAIHGLGYVALRYFNAAGASGGRGEAHVPETHLIPNVLQVPLGQRESVTLFGDDYDTPDGACVRDYIHIVDLAQAHVLALAALADAPGQAMTFNLGNGAGYSNRQVVEVARQVTGHPIPATIGPRRPGDAPRLVASAQAIKRELGWQPRYPALQDIIASAWEWHRLHPNGYEA